MSAALTNAARERPILFSGAMVRALLRERDPKTQTRRIINPQPQPHPALRPEERDRGQWMFIADSDRPAVSFATGGLLRCPYGAPGDRLVVRETWRRAPGGGVEYRATYEDDPADHACGCDGDSQPDCAACAPWKPSIHMRRADARILLAVGNVRVERLQAISEEDARAEGIPPHAMPGHWSSATPGPVGAFPSAREAFELTWDVINRKRAPWKANPWVWVVTFKRVQP